MKSSNTLLLTLISCTLFGINGLNNKFNIAEWNKTTLASLKKDIIQSRSIKEKSLYQNRFEVFKENEPVNQMDKSLRFKLWQQTVKNGGGAGDFYIVETMTSGEKVTYTTFLIYSDKGNFYIDIYRFKLGSWVKYKSLKEPQFILETNQNKVPFGTGFIHDDIIISKFNGLRVLNVDYYISTTLNKKSKLIGLLLGGLY